MGTNRMLGSRHRLADGGRVGSIVLVALDVRLHIAGRHLTYIVSKRPKLACPMVRCGASFHADQTRRQLREERQHLRTPQPASNHYLAGGIDAVHLEHVLGQINPDRANLHVDGSLM
jgi:hypothetical protein